jgi:23S rRNA (guanosine2251-2'-O)-methyltransferase
VKKSLKFNRSVLKNIISHDLFIVGKNSIIELFDRYHTSFDFIVVPTTYNSSRIRKIVDLSKNYKVRLIEDSGLIDFIESNFNIDSSGVFVALKKPIYKYYSLKEIVPMIDQMEVCTVVAFHEIDFEQNLGAMLRTCLGLNVDFILTSNKQQKIFSSTVTKVSMGYNYLVPVVRENFLLSIEELKKLRFDIVGLDMNGENLQNIRYNPKVCFVVGNESKGLSDPIARKCDKIVSIPMNNIVESLNVSTSLGITLYDRNFKLKD